MRSSILLKNTCSDISLIASSSVLQGFSSTCAKPHFTHFLFTRSTVRYSSALLIMKKYNMKMFLLEGLILSCAFEINNESESDMKYSQVW